MHRLLLAIALVLAAGLPTAQAEEWMVEAHYPDHAALIRATSKLQHAIVDTERQVLRVDTDENGIAALKAAGLSVSIDMVDTARLRAFQSSMDHALQVGSVTTNAAGYPSIPGRACYRTVEGTYQTMEDLEAAYPELVEVHDIGPSWQLTRGTGGYQMRSLRVTNLASVANEPNRPTFVALGSIHAREYTPAELLTRMAEWLVTGYGTDPQATWLVDHVDFRFILQANPDGRKKAETGASWRKNANNSYGACSGTSQYVGIDLNRNFPFHWNTTNGGGSSGNPCNQTYRGPSAGSEPETQNLVRYVAGMSSFNGYQGGALPDGRQGDVSGPAPDDYAGLFFDIHSYSKLVLWSWGDTYTPAPNDDALRTLGRRMAWFNGYTPQASVELYPTDGTTDDTFYGLIGAPSYTIELGVEFFESCTTFQNTTYPVNIAALKYAARTTVAPYQLPAGPDVRDITTSAPLQGPAGSYVQINAVIDDLRYNNSNGTQATYAIQAANAYIDTPPWAANAVAIPLQPTDGVFNGKFENVTGEIPLAGLASGRHLVYVQGINALSGGTAGAPDAVFIDVLLGNEIFLDDFE